MPFRTYVTAMTALCAFSSAAGATVTLSPTLQPGSTNTAAPATVLWHGPFLAQTRTALNSTCLKSGGSGPLCPSLAKLVGYADHWANESAQNRTFSVMTKPDAGPSGNKHAFFSLGTYWWPNPNTKTGLPYVHRDGLVNPETFKYDSVPLSQMIFAVSNLSLGYYFTGEKRYCSGAVHFIDTFFLDPATRMDPTVGLQYSQEIRGSDEGRGIGIIDAKDLAFVWDSALLLDRCAVFSGTQRAALQAWLGDYVHWLATSSHASDEFGQQNNHGTWFDEQAITLSMHVGNKTWTEILAKDALKRVAVQIEPNGTMPRELSRTRSMHYTWWNTIAFFELAHAITVADVGVDLFHYTTADNRSLRRSLDFIAPWTSANPPGTWPYAEVSPFDHGKFYQIFRVASIVWADSSYEAMIPKLTGNVNYGANIIDLVWPKGATPS